MAMYFSRLCMSKFFFRSLSGEWEGSPPFFTSYDNVDNMFGEEEDKSDGEKGKTTVKSEDKAKPSGAKDDIEIKEEVEKEVKDEKESEIDKEKEAVSMESDEKDVKNSETDMENKESDMEIEGKPDESKMEETKDVKLEEEPMCVSESIPASSEPKAKEDGARLTINEDKPMDNVLSDNEIKTESEKELKSDSVNELNSSMSSNGGESDDIDNLLKIEQECASLQNLVAKQTEGKEQNNQSSLERNQEAAKEAKTAKGELDMQVDNSKGNSEIINTTKENIVNEVAKENQEKDKEKETMTAVQAVLSLSKENIEASKASQVTSNIEKSGQLDAKQDLNKSTRVNAVLMPSNQKTALKETDSVSEAIPEKIAKFEDNNEGKDPHKGDLMTELMDTLTSEPEPFAIEPLIIAPLGKGVNKGNADAIDKSNQLPPTSKANVSDLATTSSAANAVQVGTTSVVQTSSSQNILQQLPRTTTADAQLLVTGIEAIHAEARAKQNGQAPLTGLLPQTQPNQQRPPTVTSGFVRQAPFTPSTKVYLFAYWHICYVP